MFISSSSRPSRGAKPREADDRKLPQRQPHQVGSRGGGEIKAGVPQEAPVTQAMTIETRRAPVCAVSLFPLWCKGGKHRPRHQEKVTIPVQRDQDQPDNRMEVTMEPKTASSPVLLAAEDHLWSGQLVLDVPLQNGQLLAPFPLIIWGEAQGLYK